METDRQAGEFPFFAEAAQEIVLIGLREQLGVVDEEHDFGWGERTGTAGFDLGRVEELEAFVRAHRGRVNLEALLEIAVEFASSHAAGRVLADFFNGTKEAGDILARAGRKSHGRGVG